MTPIALLVACATTPSVDAPSGDPLAEIHARAVASVEPAPAAEGPPVLLTGGTVLTAAGERFEPGYVAISGGYIRAVGAGEPPADLALEQGTVTLDVSGRYLTPGLIDTHSHLGVYPSPGDRAHSDGNEATAPTTPGVWAEHSFWPQDPGIELAVAGGVTTIQALPGSANLVGGRGVVLHMVPTRGSRAMRFPGAPETVKMACGENPKRVYGEKGGPSTRMGNVRGHRAAFIAAEEYREAWDDYAEKIANGEEADAPTRDLEKETLAGVLRGEILPQIHCYRADDMLSILQIADEFGFEVRSFHHALEAYKIRDILAEREVAASTWADWWGFKLEAYDAVPENAAMLAEAGGISIIHSDSSEGIQRLNQEAAKAWHSGRRAGIELSEDEALRWITYNPAWALGVEDQVGTLEVGKRADVVVWDAHPFSVYARAERVFIDGLLRHDARLDSPPWSDFQVGHEVNR